MTATTEKNKKKAVATEAAEAPTATTEKKKQLIFSKAGKAEKESYYLFGDTATAIAEVLQLGTTMSKKDQPMLTIPVAQFEEAKAKLEEVGYAIATEEAANKPVAELRLFEGRERSGANIFGETAKVVADALGVQAKLTRKNEFYLTIDSDQIQLAVEALTKAGYNARQLKEWTVIKYPNNRYCFLKEAATEAGEHFGLATEESQAGNAKLTVTSEQYQEFRAIAKQNGHYFKELTPSEMESRKQS